MERSKSLRPNFPKVSKFQNSLTQKSSQRDRTKVQKLVVQINQVARSIYPIGHITNKYMHLPSKFLSIPLKSFSSNNPKSSVFFSTLEINKRKKKKKRNQVTRIETNPRLILTDAYTRLNCTRPNWLRQSKLPELDRWRDGCGVGRGECTCEREPRNT